MARKSARLLGKKLGLSSAEVYQRLEAQGLVRKAEYIFHRDAVHGWELTEEGEQYGSMSSNYPIPVFDESVVDLIRN